jgi:hypothetical protein
VFLEGWVRVLCSCRFRFSWACLVGFFLSFFGLFFFSISSFAFSLVYRRCTKGRLTLLIKSVYYLSKKKNALLHVTQTAHPEDQDA